MKGKEDYCISIVGKQDCDGEITEVIVDTLGGYVVEDGIRYITYEEYDDQNPNVSSTAILKIENDSMLTMTKASSDTEIILEKEQRYSCMYDTGFGSMTMGVFTSEFKSDLTEAGGKLQVKYTLDFNANFASRNELLIEVRQSK